ncbi:hypothetical protein CRG98_029899, partial [Punica granatum]
LARASCNLAGSANPCELTFLATLPSLLTRASLLFYKLAGSTNTCELTFLHRKFTEPPRSCHLQPCQVRRATPLVLLATLPGLRTRASLLSCTACSPRHLARASCNLAGSANPCELTFLATLPSLLTRASLLFCNLAGSTNPCELTFLHRRFAEPPRSCFLQPCRVYEPVRAYFPAPPVRRGTSLVPLATLQVCRATSLVPLATLPGLLTRASLLFCNHAGASNPCELTFLHRKFAEPPRSCLLQPYRFG